MKKCRVVYRGHVCSSLLFYCSEHLLEGVIEIVFNKAFSYQRNHKVPVSILVFQGSSY